MNIVIIGKGRFGSLLEKHLSTDNEVVCLDKKENESVGTRDLASLLRVAELVIFAVPNRVLEEAIVEYKIHIPETAVVMDVGSVKTNPANLLQKHFQTNALLATHPLFGPDSAGESWEGHKMVFCKLHINDDLYEQVKNLFVTRGVVAIETTPEKHDRMMAKTQALVHFIGRALKGSESQEISTPDYANLLFMMEKVNNDTWELFFDMQNLNPYAKEERKKFLNHLNTLENQIEDSQAQK